MGVGWGTPKMAVKPAAKVGFSDPYKKCRTCGAWVDGALTGPGPLVLVPCGCQSDYDDLCPSWGPVDGCTCANYPDSPIQHDMRPPSAGDGKVY